MVKAEDIDKLLELTIKGGHPANEIWLTSEQVAECAEEIAQYEAGALSSEALLHIIGRRTARRRARNNPLDDRAKRMAFWYEGEPD